VSASDSERPAKARRVRDRNIALGVVAGLLRNSLTASAQRSHLLTTLWIELKRYGASGVSNIELSRLRGVDRVRVAGPVGRHSPLVLAALSILLECETVFEIGPDTVGVAALLAQNLPSARIFLLSEKAGRSTADGRVTRLDGDSYSFDFRPYSGTVDLVYVEASGRHSHLPSDTEAAFGMLSELGTIVWDGYSGDPGVYAYLNELAPSLDRPVFHILGTRLAFYSRWDILLDER
jgi:hypothetical protein